jgi:uncharacterized membrane protein HdeD (DUF308 family)
MRAMLKKSWVALLIHGGLNVLAGVLVLLLYSIQNISFVTLVGLFTLISGLILFMCFFYTQRRSLPVIFIGMISVMVGLWLILFSPEGLDRIKWLLGSYAALLGLVTLTLAYKTWKQDREVRIQLDEFERWY